MDPLKDKAALYTNLVKTQQDKDGFILTSQCDSLLFSSLLATVHGIRLNAAAARSPDGQWFRRPIGLYQECLACGGSDSTISRDQFLGLLCWIWANKRLDVAEALYDYGSKHWWIMGQGQIGTLWFTPSLQYILSQMIYKLGGKNHLLHRAGKFLPQFLTKTNRGYTVHLDFLSILLMAEIDAKFATKLRKQLTKKDCPFLRWCRKGYQKLVQKLVPLFPVTIQLGIDCLAFYTPADIIEFQANRVPENALFSYVLHKYSDGDFSAAITTLMDEKLFPANRLPCAKDRKEQYLWQRELGSDWQPNPGSSEEFPGCDFLFLANLILSS